LRGLGFVEQGVGPNVELAIQREEDIQARRTFFGAKDQTFPCYRDAGLLRYAERQHE
jgi:hypothetical protein